MSCTRLKDDDPFDDVIKIWEEQEAKDIAKILWPNKEWTENVNLIELHGDGEYLINGDPFTKTSSVHHTS